MKDEVRQMASRLAIIGCYNAREIPGTVKTFQVSHPQQCVDTDFETPVN